MGIINVLHSGNVGLMGEGLRNVFVFGTNIQFWGHYEDIIWGVWEVLEGFSELEYDNEGSGVGSIGIEFREHSRLEGNFTIIIEDDWGNSEGTGESFRNQTIGIPKILLPI